MIRLYDYLRAANGIEFRDLNTQDHWDDEMEAKYGLHYKPDWREQEWLALQRRVELWVEIGYCAIAGFMATAIAFEAWKAWRDL